MDTDKFVNSAVVPTHLGIIMDGNGRWAEAHNLPRPAGHLAGVQNIRPIIQSCIDLHVQVLTLYAFSTENWQRSSEEVKYLMDLASEYAVKELPVLQTLGVRLQLLGRREELPSYVLDPLSHSIAQTQDNTNITVNLALNYGGRRELIDAVQKILADYKKGIIKNPEISEETIQQYLYWPDCPDVDLIIRTSGENRISNFLLWQSANTFFFSTPVLWPDFKGKDLLELMDLYRVQTISQSSTDY